MTTTVDTLVDHYLHDLYAALGDLPANQRQEILDEVGEHITAARAALDTETEAEVRTVLERLGDPADIAAEARERFGVPAEPARPPTPWLEIVALVALVIPFLGWVVGVVLVWLSRRWTTRDKLIGTLGGLSWVAAGLATVMVEVTSLPASTSGSGTPVGSPRVVESTGPGAIGVILVVAPFVLPIAAAVYLAIRLRAHAGTVPEPHERSEHGTAWLEVATLVVLLIPFLGWVVGVVLLWLSRTWTTREKAVGTLLALGAGALALAALSSPVEWLRPLLVMVMTVPTVGYLAIRLRDHASAVPASG